LSHEQVRAKHEAALQLENEQLAERHVLLGGDGQSAAHAMKAMVADEGELNLSNLVAKAMAGSAGTVLVFGRNLPAAMSLVHTPARLKHCHACGQWHSSQLFTASYRLAL
jgi:hypothetical protein